MAHMIIRYLDPGQDSFQVFRCLGQEAVAGFRDTHPKP